MGNSAPPTVVLRSVTAHQQFEKKVFSCRIKTLKKKHTCCVVHLTIKEGLTGIGPHYINPTLSGYKHALDKRRFLPKKEKKPIQIKKKMGQS